jgi:hypothetical protein
MVSRVITTIIIVIISITITTLGVKDAAHFEFAHAIGVN